MLKNSAVSEGRNRIFKSIVIGSIAGGILGAALGYWGFIPTFLHRPSGAAITGTTLGIFFGGCISGLIKLFNGQDKTTKYINDIKIPEQKLKLREEQIDISKKWIQTGEVTVHKEVLTQEKNITVPVTHEELVIEKKVLDEPVHTETIRIPISEERIEITKHPVILEDVEIKKRQFQEIETVKQTLKKEKLHLETTGNPQVIDKEADH